MNDEQRVQLQAQWANLSKTKNIWLAVLVGTVILNIGSRTMLLSLTTSSVLPDWAQTLASAVLPGALLGASVIAALLYRRVQKSISEIKFQLDSDAFDRAGIPAAQTIATPETIAAASNVVGTTQNFSPSLEQAQERFKSARSLYLTGGVISVVGGVGIFLFAMLAITGFFSCTAQTWNATVNQLATPTCWAGVNTSTNLVILSVVVCAAGGIMALVTAKNYRLAEADLTLWKSRSTNL